MEKKQAMNYHQEATALHKNKKILECGYLLLAGFVCLLLASRSSFLYPCNDWNDANSYFSVGKALFNGRMPYRDVFDQKGMFLYFFYGLAYLVSHTTFAGVFLMEVVLAFFDLVGIFHILLLSLKRETAFVLSPLALAVIVSSKSFYWGGSAEELCLPFLIWGLYLVLSYFQKCYPKEKMSFRTIFIGGLLAGMVANIKFTGLGFFFAWMMCVAFAFLVQKDFWGAVKGCLIFLGGMAVPFIPWVIYFGVQGALYEWYWGYVFINVFVYSNLNGEGPSLMERIYTLSKLLYWLIRSNLVYFIAVIPGVFWFLLGKERKWLERFCVAALCFFLFLGIYVGGSELPYYALPLSVFTPLGFAFLGKLIEWLSCRVKKQMAIGTNAVWTQKNILLEGTAAAAALFLGAATIWTQSMNIPFMQEKREDLFLYQFKEIVEEVQDPTLLNIGCLDAGLYTVCDIVPTCRWFQTQTLEIDDVLIEQERYIREGQTDFVIARDSYPEVIWDKYELVAEAPWYLDELEFTYYLFRLKDL